MKQAEFYTSIVNLDEMPSDGWPQIAMVGRSNVGKSSLINHLTGRNNLARESSKPGRTQTINLYKIDQKFYLIDLPGYGFAQKSLKSREGFADLIQNYLLNTTALRLVFLVIDSRIPLSDLDVSMLEWLDFNNLPFAIILNKVDKATKKQISELRSILIERFPEAEIMEHSVDSAKSIPILWQEIDRVIV